MHILLKVWQHDEYYDGNCDYALVTITPDFAGWALEMIGLACQIAAEHHSFYQMEFFNNSPQVFGWYEGLEDELRRMSNDTSQSLFAQLEEQELVILPDSLHVPEDYYERVDVVTLQVRTDEIAWYGYVKHTHVTWDTRAIPVTVLEEVAGKKVQSTSERLFEWPDDDYMEL